MAAGDAHALALEFSRRTEKLLAVAPKLRAKRAVRVVELLLTEDCIAASRAAKIAGLSDRAARRLFDRLVEPERVARSLGATELSALRAVTAMAQTKRRIQAFDTELSDLPQAARWREWMLRVEAAIFAATEPLPRDALARLVGPNCNLDDLLTDLTDELRARPYDLVCVAGGYQLRTKPRFADAIRAANAGGLRDAGLPELTPTELLAVTAIAYLQPATRAQISQLAGETSAATSSAR